MASRKPRSYPQDATIEQWFIANDTDGPRIKRFVKHRGRRIGVERLPLSDYRHLLGNRRELEDFVIRRNGRDPREVRAKELVQYRHAFLSPETLREYRDIFLPMHIPTKKDQRTMFAYLQEYALNWFSLKRNLPNPISWHIHQQEWGKYLLNDRSATAFKDRLALFEDGDRLSAKVIRQVINELNRFMRYLHQKRPNEIPPLKFSPFSVAMLRKHDADRKVDNDFRESKFVKADHWKKIEKALERRNFPWRHAVYLMHRYGLRRNEAFGLALTDVRRGYLSVERQLEKYIVVREDEVEKAPKYRRKTALVTGDGRKSPGRPSKLVKKKKYKKVKIRAAKCGPVKDREKRRVPHWFSTAGETQALIARASAVMLHPDTVTREFSLLMKDLGLPEYVLKDLRRTWVTNALRGKKDAEDVRLAAGHSDLQTTYRHYVSDERELDDQIWEPDNEVA